MRLLQDRGIEYNFIQSGQHKETMDDILDNFKLHKQPDFCLYEGDDITGVLQMAKWLIGILRTFTPGPLLQQAFRNDHNGIVINHGDTISTLLGSFLARRQGLYSAHVESGLRSFNLFHPFPEELSRLLTFRYSDYFFAPGDWAMENLKRYSGTKINTHHNTLYDALKYSPDPKSISNTAPYALISIHRFENIFSRKRLAFVIDQITSDVDGLKKLFILHKPTEKKLKEFGLYEKLASNNSIELHPRYDYFQFMSLLKSSEYLISDGGSNQEECFYLGIPCLLMRKATERNEGLGGNVLLSEYNTEKIQFFMENYKQFVRSPLTLEESPTEIIVRELIATGLAGEENSV